ncbi:MAG: hypothetical protein K8S15_09170, partial [Candidatus Aegiribacteria sp.]|nr:hypothetical protein [Candidatus Aegiribacteria sp.]
FRTVINLCVCLFSDYIPLRAIADENSRNRRQQAVYQNPLLKKCWVNWITSQFKSISSQSDDDYLY